VLEQDQLAQWVVGPLTENTNEKGKELVEASRRAWPRVLAHTRRELSHRELIGPEITSLALEIWEAVLRSVWRTLQRSHRAAGIRDLENYLIGAFHHRLNRRLQRMRCRDAVLEFLPPEKLVEIPSPETVDEQQAVRTHRRIQLDQVYAMMDENIRKAMIARAYGFSWSEIAKTFQIEEQNLIMRVQYALRKVREKLSRHSSGAAEGS